MAVISVMVKICLQTVIFHSSIEDAITTMTELGAEYIDNELSMEPSFDM